MGVLVRPGLRRGNPKAQGRGMGQLTLSSGVSMFPRKGVGKGKLWAPV